MIPNAVLIQIMVFLQVFTYAMIGIGVIFAVWFFVNYKYKVELTLKTGTGKVLRRKYARKVPAGDGNYRLKTLFGKCYLYPKDDSFLYKDGLFYLIRFYQKADSDYHPISLMSRVLSKQKSQEHKEAELKEMQNYAPMVMEEETELYMKPIPQNIRFVFKSDLRAINEKYEKQKNFMQQYGQLIGLGFVVVAFIIGIYFIMEHVDAAIQLGNQALALAKTLQPNALQSASPP